MKRLKYTILFIVAALTLYRCDNNFEEINKNIDDPVSIPSSMLIGTIVRNVTNQMYSTFTGLEHGETWVQHISMVQYNDPERYKPRETTQDGLWNTFYLAASDAMQMYNLAEAEGNSVNMGIALVLKAYCFTLLTDIYGDVPYTEALLGPGEGVFTPAYDVQETVYDGVFATLDEAMPLLASGEGTTDPGMDIMYAGDASKWEKFAASLKFRALMRISSKRDVSADLQALVNSGKLFSSMSDEAKLVYLPDAPEANPVYETIVTQGRGEFKLAETLVEYLKSISDPRLPVYAQLAVNSGEYVGKPSGYEESPLPGYGYDDVSSLGVKYLEATQPGYHISYTELLFLLSEAAQKGYISGGDATAESYYNAAVTNSFAENGIASEAAAYLAQYGVTYDAATAMEKICRQKWVALFSQGWEAWTEWRRTKLPALTPVPDGYFDEIPSRLKYEADESSVNGAQYNIAVERIGDDEITTPVWWMQ